MAVPPDKHARNISTQDQGDARVRWGAVIQKSGAASNVERKIRISRSSSRKRRRNNPKG